MANETQKEDMTNDEPAASPNSDVDGDDLTRPRDADLVKALELSESDLAVILGKTRQSVNYTLQKGDSPHGLKTHELSQLHSYFLVREKSKSRLIRKHIEMTRDEGELRKILSKNGLFLTRAELDAAQSVMLVIPDYRYFRVNHPSHCRAFLERARKDATSVLCVATLKEDCALFWEDALQEEANQWEDKLPHMITPLAGAYPYIVFLEPDPSAKIQSSCWVQGAGGFQLGDELRADSMFRFLLEETKPLNFSPHPGLDAAVRRSV